MYQFIRCDESLIQNFIALLFWGGGLFFLFLSAFLSGMETNCLFKKNKTLIYQLKVLEMFDDYSFNSSDGYVYDETHWCVLDFKYLDTFSVLWIWLLHAIWMFLLRGWEVWRSYCLSLVLFPYRPSSFCFLFFKYLQIYFETVYTVMCWIKYAVKEKRIRSVYVYTSLFPWNSAKWGLPGLVFTLSGQLTDLFSYSIITGRFTVQ